MYIVYILKSFKNRRIYIGYSTDVHKRVIEHNENKVISTRGKGPWKLVYFESFLSKEDALKREKLLKNYGSALGHLKKRISNSLSQI